MDNEGGSPTKQVKRPRNKTNGGGGTTPEPSTSRDRKARPWNLEPRHLVLPRFVGVDGEGGNIGKTHRFLLLRAGGDVIENPDGLSMAECLGFLADLPKNGRIYVSFAFDYDVTMMMRQAHPAKVNRLFNRASRQIVRDGRKVEQYHPVEVGDFEVDYMPHKEFKVRRKGTKRYTVVNDSFTFFQTSFIVALRKWFPGEEYAKDLERIAKGKEQRHDFGAVDDNERAYNLLEIVYLEKLMETFRQMCLSLDIRPHKWQGPGHLVSAVFTREGLPKNNTINASRDVLESANLAYVGGRFECRSFGHIDGTIYQYDINSAYASVYKELPCLIHGSWVPIKTLPRKPGSIYLARVSFKHTAGLAWNTLPIRSKKGTILFPREGNGWYWCHELEVAKDYSSLTIHEGYKYVKSRECVCRPFDWVYPLYDLRRDVGKETGKGKVLKTTLATIYGKTAQSIGHPQWSNPIWAGLITSSCRAKLIVATLSVDRGNGVHMLATDGLFTSAPIPGLTIGKDLGQWELTEHESMFIVQSGLYLLPNRVKILHKTRGVPIGVIMQKQPEIRAAWQAWLDEGDCDADSPTVTVPVKTFISLRLANSMGKGFMAGRWINAKRTIRFDWGSKREFGVRNMGTYVTTRPLQGSPTLQSEASGRVVGGHDLLEMAFEDAPDWADQLTLEDE